jgi:hypothetical protein
VDALAECAAAEAMMSESMSISTCPTDIVAASQKRVWELLTYPVELARWSGAKLRQGPPRPLEAGDVVVLGAGPGRCFKVTIEIKQIEPLRELTLDVQLPLGIVNHEVVVVAPLGPERCRVTLN